MIDEAFHNSNVFYTPLVGHGMVMPPGVGWDQYWYTGGELVPSHVNHETIGRYQRYLGPIYIDTRQKRVRARNHYAAKWQMDEMDSMVDRYGSDTPSFITRVLDAQLADQIVGIQEKCARDAMLDFALFKYLPDGSAWDATTNNFSNISASAVDAFDVTVLEEVALRMSYRVEDTLHKWGNYAQPVPGSNFRDSVLVMVTTGTFWEIWNSNAQEFMVNLRQLQDDRIINGGQVQWRNMTIVDTGHGMVLWNSGNLTKQVAVTSPISWGDGAPDPGTTLVDDVWLAGQSSDPTHYVQCTDLGTDKYVAGDFVSIHTGRTSEYGITDGCDPLHGKTYRAEIYSVDEATERITFRKPITEEYKTAMDYVSLNGAATAGQAYAYITKAQHIHPTLVVGAREMIQWVGRKKPNGALIDYHRPTDNDADIPSIHRVVADWFGEMNRWNLDVYEVFFSAAPFANRAGKSY